MSRPKTSSQPTQRALPATTLEDAAVRTRMTAAALQQAGDRSFALFRGCLPAVATPHDYYHALALAVRDRGCSCAG